MASKYSIPLIGSLVIAACAAFGATASAATFCPTSESFFGTIQRVNGSMLTVQTPSGHWADIRVESGARVNANGMSLRPGTFVGAFGCVTPNGVFNANEVTLSANRAAYNEQLSGVVQRIQTGKLIVRETSGSFGAWFVPDTDEFHVGQTVTANGMRSSNGSFYPQTINGRMVAFDTDVTTEPSSSARNTVTLSGTVQRVGGNTLLVWEPASRHSATWVVSNAGSRFRVGERVSATGHEDRFGRFYVQQITIL
ncbi:MAG TPA: hypothetical protein VJP85_08545 [Candidatus Baltobacteraceae bacterium]|nr:hypothetical protein [Candidatus Baltobacteraceae bacterium]